jgi:hypothetical protein
MKLRKNNYNSFQAIILINNKLRKKWSRKEKRILILMIHNKQIIKTPEIAYLITKTFKHNRTCYKLREVG